jgi:hypothetical protein
MGVIYETANEGLLSRVIPLTLYYTLRLINEIVIEILRNGQFLFRICAGIPAMIVRVYCTLRVHHHFSSILVLF